VYLSMRLRPTSVSHRKLSPRLVAVLIIPVVCIRLVYKLAMFMHTVILVLVNLTVSFLRLDHEFHSQIQHLRKH